MAGLPGTGLGGIFYALLIVWMAVREVWLLVHKRSSQERWRAIVTFGLILAAIVVVLAGEFWFIQYALHHWISPVEGPNAYIYKYLQVLTPTLIVTPFLILGTMLILLHLATRLLTPPSDTVTPSSS
ncbi:MAG: hypothetical protein APF80_13375 [Alphaproteobacteria bacterium BRH_c36]|nr:MAG: hypothetical protein APF80_13375 [Alphaproteobacteria bacterium BRH_c36]